jgi:signal transduction histidine kinase
MVEACKNIFHNLTRAGTDPEASRAYNMAIRNGNVILLVSIFIVLSYVPIDIYAGDTALVLLNFLTGAGYTICYFLIRSGRTRVGRTVAFFIGSTTIYLSADAMGSQSMVHLYELLASIMPFLAFSKEDRRYMYASVASAVFLWFLYFLLPEHFFMPAAKHPELYTRWIPIFFTPALIVLVILQTYYLFQDLIETAERQKRELVHSSRMAAVGEMAGGVAHEIKTPLAIIAGSIDRIRAEGVKDTQIAKLDMIERTVARMSRVVTGLLTFSRTSNRAAEMPDALIPISVPVETVLNLCTEKFKSGGIDFRVNIDSQVLLKVEGDHIAQVLLNLLNNAFDAVESMHEPWIELAGRREGERYLITVTDAGHGIAPEIVERMMEPFFTTKAIGKGTGLGLSVSKGFIEAYDGKLYYHLHDGQTQFVIDLPLHTDEVINVLDIVENK